jgi:hypothetical protein
MRLPLTRLAVPLAVWAITLALPIPTPAAAQGLPTQLVIRIPQNEEGDTKRVIWLHKGGHLNTTAMWWYGAKRQKMDVEIRGRLHLGMHPGPGTMWTVKSFASPAVHSSGFTRSGARPT